MPSEACARIVRDMQCSAAFVGSALLVELQTSDKLSAAAARAWIAKKSGHLFDPEAMYQLRWPSSEDSATWGGFLDMSVHIMSDQELVQLERERRRLQGLPQRRPWEPPLFGTSMGRAGGSY